MSRPQLLCPVRSHQQHPTVRGSWEIPVHTQHFGTFLGQLERWLAFTDARVLISGNNAYNKGNSFLATLKPVKGRDHGVGGNLERELDPLLPRTTSLRTSPFLLLPSPSERTKGATDPGPAPLRSTAGTMERRLRPQPGGRKSTGRWWETCGICVRVVRPQRGVRRTDATQEMHGGTNVQPRGQDRGRRRCENALRVPYKCPLPVPSSGQTRVKC